METIQDRIDNALNIDSTFYLVREFIEERENIQELILIVCARLDSLSNLAFTNKSQRENFIGFLSRHSSIKKRIYDISLPDLYYNLSYRLYSMPAIIDTPGRLQILDPLEDEQFVSFLWNSGLAVTEKDMSRLIAFIAKNIQKKYRVTPTQSKRKPSIDTLTNIFNYLVEASKTYRKGLFDDAIQQIKPILKDYSMGSLLYREYRCKIIHERGVDVDEEKFFQEYLPYFETTYNDYVDPGKFLTLEFPARFLIGLLDSSFKNFVAELKHKMLLPSALFFEICELSELEYLDHASFNEGKDANISF